MRSRCLVKINRSSRRACSRTYAKGYIVPPLRAIVDVLTIAGPPARRYRRKHPAHNTKQCQTARLTSRPFLALRRLSAASFVAAAAFVPAAAQAVTLAADFAAAANVDARHRLRATTTRPLLTPALAFSLSAPFPRRLVPATSSENATRSAASARPATPGLATLPPAIGLCHAPQPHSAPVALAHGRVSVRPTSTRIM
jgi:hypothetical protein